MSRHLILNEMWVEMSGWPYEVSSHGHIRRRQSEKAVDVKWDREGFGHVELNRGRRRQKFCLDSIVCSVFTGTELNGVRPLHLDGLPWNNWPKNLQWSMRPNLGSGDNLVTSWTVIRKGKPAGGPFTDPFAAHAAAQWEGDVILGRNNKRQIVAYEIMFSRNREMSPRNPFDLAKYYRAEAERHSSQFWSNLLAEAALMIEVLANDNLNYITQGKPETLALGQPKPVDVAAPPVGRRALPVEPPQAEPPPRRRSLPGAAQPQQDEYLKGIMRRRALPTA